MKDVICRTARLTVFVTAALNFACTVFEDDTKTEKVACVSETTQRCGTNLGQCRFGEQKCEDGIWGECIGGTTPTIEVCDGEDNNCDGNVDEGFSIGTACDLPGGCPGQLVCSADQTASICATDVTLQSPEICDGKDNNCDDWVDYTVTAKGLISACDCREQELIPQELEEDTDRDLPDGLCSETVCESDGSEWRMHFCLDGSVGSGWAICEGKEQMDLSGFDQGQKQGTGVIKIEYTTEFTAPLGAVINLWYADTNSKKRKYLPLQRVASSPGTYVQYFLPGNACYPSWWLKEQTSETSDPLLDCRGSDTDCPGCAASDSCGKPVGAECHLLNFSAATLQIATEWQQTSTDIEGAVSIRSLSWQSPGCF